MQSTENNCAVENGNVANEAFAEAFNSATGEGVPTPKEGKKGVSIRQDLVQQIVDYLADRPYREVFAILNPLLSETANQ